MMFSRPPTPRSIGFASLAALVALGCSTGSSTGGGGLGFGDGGRDSGTPGTDGGGDPAIVPVEGTGVYDTGDTGRLDAMLCPASSQVEPGCIAELDEGAIESLCNGSDDDCDGEVDEMCYCEPGAVQRCFRGPPGRRGEGACQDGQQTCVANGEFGGVWGPCTGGIAPSGETCDGLDNNCNGCTDELEGCVPDGTCPGPGDPRVPDARPFSTYTLNGSEFYPGDDAVAWRWEIVGTPCDQMFQGIPGSTATSDNGQLSYRLAGGSTANASVDFTLSGDYEVTMTVERRDGSEFSCTWIVPVRAPGLRVEACWDATGPTASSFGGTVDVDLHLGKHGATTSWFDGQDCDYSTCKSYSFERVDWGYPDTPLSNCTGPGSRGDFTDSCPNPRLDIDNISQSSEYVPENINLDNPRDGDRFRVMVHHYTSSLRATRPIVNVYCGGQLTGTYGAAPDTVEGFDEGGGRMMGDMWRVVDIETHVDGSGTTTGCDLTPIRPPGRMSGYHVTLNDPTF